MTTATDPDYPLKEIPQPHAHDVLCGRGGGTNQHVGNSHWRMLVAANKQLYITLPKRQKMLLSRSIVNAVRSQKPPGRFLQKDSQTSLWYDVGDQRAQEKTSQALREGAPEIRKKAQQQQAETTESSSAAAQDQEAVDSNLGDSVSTDLASNETEEAGSTSKQLSAEQKQKQQQQESEPQRAISGGSESDQAKRNKNSMPPPQSKTPPINNGIHQSYQPNMAQDPQMMFFNGQMPQGMMMPGFATNNIQNGAQQQQMMYYQNNGGQMQLYPTMILNDQGMMVPAMGVMPYGMMPPASGLAPPTNPTSRTTSSESQQREAGDQLNPLPHLPQNQQQYRSQQNQLPSFEDAQILPPGALEPGTYSFGSISMSDAEQLNLESTGISFGSTMSTNTTRTNNTLGPAYEHSHPDALPQIDLESTGISFGGMSIGSLPQGRLEDAGTSFGSAMSINTEVVRAAMVDGGLEAVGTSFGSLSLDTTNRETLFQSLEEAAAGPEIPPMFQGERSSGNLLECSDTESEGEDEKHELQAQKSAMWEKMQESLARQSTQRASNHPGGQQVGNDDHTPPSGQKTVVPPMSSIPITNMERDFSALSGIEVDGDDHLASVPKPPAMANKHDGL
jgi:hypothetical protein